MILVATAFHSEYSEDLWESIPGGPVLPHPTFEGNVSLADVNLDGARAKALTANGPEKPHPHAAKKVRQSHIDALGKHPALGFEEGDTVLDISRKAQAIHPEVRVRGLR
jgi:hypothetical protein